MPQQRVIMRGKGDIMFEKKNLIVNCDVCDARKVQEEGMSGYERIILNTDFLLVDERSRGILNNLPMVCNADETLEVEGEVSVISVNGDYEISGNTLLGDQAVICVNGDLTVRPGTEKVLEKILRICVNGSAKYPESMGPYMNKLTVNGSVQCIPDGCIELKPVYTIDKYFPLRARQDGVYYVDEKVMLTDLDVDLEALAAKNVRFMTKHFLVREELVPQSIAMFDESVELHVVPAGFAFVDGDAQLDETLVRTYGKRLYIDGNLTLKDGSEGCFDGLEKLCVNGDVRLLKRQAEAFARVDAVYGKLVFVKGRYIENSAAMTVDKALLEASSDGLEIGNCAILKVKDDVEPELILDRLYIRNCAHIRCNPEQKSSLQLVCGNVAKISDGEKDGEDAEEGGILGMLKKALDSKVVNADTYIL